MKIGLIVRGLTRGGVTRLINNILRELDDSPHDKLELVLFTDNATYISQYKNIKVIYRRSWHKIFWDFFQIIPALVKEKCSSIVYPKSVIPLSHFFLRFKKYVIIHDLAYFDLALNEYKFFDTLYMKTFIPISCWKADGILAVSQATKNDLIKRFRINPYKIEVINEAVESSFKPITDESVLKRLPIKKPYLFYCGPLSPRKNMLRVCQAFRQIQDQIPHRLYLAGGESWHDREVISFIRHHLPDRAFRLGYVTEAELVALYSQAGLFFYPSLYEGFGLPILEAQASGCPVLTSNISSCLEVAGQGAHLVDPYSVEEIRDGIMKIVTDQEYRNRLIELGRKNVERFSWEKVAEKIIHTVKTIETNAS